MNRFLRYKYNKAKEIYIVALWARFGVLKAKFSGKFDKNNEPLTIQYSDHNGEYESYHVAPWYLETTGITVAYFFTEERAKILTDTLNKLSGY